MQKLNTFRLKFALIIAALIMWECLVFGKFTGTFPEAIKNAINCGNTIEIAKYFQPNVEVDILGDENNGNKERAEKIISNFFSQHPVSKFTIVYEGGKDTSQYSVGKLITSKGVFRVSILLEGENIQQIRIEDENGN